VPFGFTVISRGLIIVTLDWVCYCRIDGRHCSHAFHFGQLQRCAMKKERGSIELKLTPEQQEQIRQATGKLTDTLEMSIMELEERITPARSSAY